MLRVLVRMRFRSGFKKMEAVPEDLFILANGPSLKQDIEKFGEKIAANTTMGVNLFAMNEAFSTMKPGYYILLDINFFKEDVILERVRESREKLIQGFRQNLTWEMNLFLPAEAKGTYFHKQMMEANLPLNFVFFNRTSLIGIRAIRHCMYSRGWGMPPPQNVLIGALMAAILTGFKKIYILGADHSWHEDISVKDDNSLEVNDKHFYNPKGRKLPKHHGETLHRLMVHDFFTDLARTFKSHQMVNEFARHKGVEIINASSKSYIDAYPRESLDKLWP